MAGRGNPGRRRHRKSLAFVRAGGQRGQPARRRDGGLGGPVNGADHLVTVDTNGFICEYHAGRPLAGHCADTPFNSLSTVSLDQAGTEAAVTGGSGATVWSVPGFKEIFPTNNTVWGVGNVSSAALSRNGRELATTSVEGITQVTDLYGPTP